MLKSFVNLVAAATFLVAAPASAQIQTVDPGPSQSYPQSSPSDPADPADDWAPAPEAAPPAAQYPADDWAPNGEQAVDPAPADDWAPADPQTGEAAPADVAPLPEAAPTTEGAAAGPAPAPAADTIPREDLFTAAEDLFGRGAEGLAGMLENILRDQGQPSAYISGQEAGGAFVFGVRYGSGTMRHQVEGDRAVYWTGPSLGFDFGADASKVFVLVYNLHDSQQLFKRFAGAEGRAYFVGGFTAQYLRRGDVVLIPIRLGVGLRVGVNAGYMRFTERNRWVPF